MPYGEDWSSWGRTEETPKADDIGRANGAGDFVEAVSTRRPPKPLPQAEPTLDYGDPVLRTDYKVVFGVDAAGVPTITSLETKPGDERDHALALGVVDRMIAGAKSLKGDRPREVAYPLHGL